MYMHIYMNNPTAGAADGTQISEGTGLAQLKIGPLNAANNEESAPVKLAIRCESGYKTGDVTTIALSGTNAEKWVLAYDSNNTAGTFGSWGGSLSFPSGIGEKNTIFWIKAKTDNSEKACNDASVNLSVSCPTIAAI